MPDLVSDLGLEVPSPLPSSTDTVPSRSVSNGQVDPAVAGEVAGHDGIWEFGPTA